MKYIKFIKPSFFIVEVLKRGRNVPKSIHVHDTTGSSTSGYPCLQMLNGVAAKVSRENSEFWIKLHTCVDANAVFVLQFWLVTPTILIYLGCNSNTRVHGYMFRFTFQIRRTARTAVVQALSCYMSNQFSIQHWCAASHYNLVDFAVNTKRHLWPFDTALSVNIELLNYFPRTSYRCKEKGGVYELCEMCYCYVLQVYGIKQWPWQCLRSWYQEDVCQVLLLLDGCVLSLYHWHTFSKAPICACQLPLQCSVS